MTKKKGNTNGGKAEDPGKPQGESYGLGPATEKAIRERLEMMAAFAFMGKRAFTQGEIDQESCEKYLQEINSPFQVGHLIEQAFDGLLKLACEAWNETLDPRDSVKGQVIHRTKSGQKVGQEEGQ